MTQALRLPIGIHLNVPEADYHADPAETPSASASILRLLHESSAEHAWHGHPRLNPQFEERPASDVMIAGRILHAEMTGTPATHRVLDFDDYRSNAAKAARDAAIASGWTPILRHKLEALEPVAAALRARIQRDHPNLHAAIHHPDSAHEATMIWQDETKVLCRARADLLPPAEFGFIGDFKFTSRSAEPDAYSKKMIGDHLLQAVFYPRGIEALRGDEPEMHFIVCETDEPYGVSVHALDPALADIGRRRLTRALERWGYCLANDKWPGYPPFVHYTEAPGWMLSREEDRAIRDAAAQEYERRQKIKREARAGAQA